MKKSLLVLAMLISAAATYAIDLNKSSKFENRVPMKSQKVMMESGVTKKLAAKKAGEAAAIAGTYIYADVDVASVDNVGINTSGEMTIAATADGYTVSGFFGTEAAVSATFDEATQTLTIPRGQVIYSSSTYGDCGLYAYVGNSYVDLTFTYDAEKQAFSLDQDGIDMVILTGTYGGYFLAEEEQMGMGKANGTIASTVVKQDLTPAATPETAFDAWVVVNKESKIGFVAGIDGLTWESFTFDDEGTVTFAQDNLVYYSSSYTPGKWAMVVENSGMASVATTVVPEGTIDVSNSTACSLNIGAWAFYLASASNPNSIAVLNGYKTGSVVSFTLPEDAPTPSSIQNVEVKNAGVKKVIVNGAIYIQKGDVRYNLQGGRME